jgi:enamine deaminase RidA (YjgF/YER057c/UK114 family)
MTMAEGGSLPGGPRAEHAAPRAVRLGGPVPDLPAGSLPVGTYVKATRWRDLLFVSGHGPVTHEGDRVVGKVGSDLDVPQAYDAARLVGLGILSTLRTELGDLGHVARVLKLLGMVNAAPGFTDAPAVVDGCSDVLAEVLGVAVASHARSAVCVAELPFGIPVEVEAVIALRD